MNTTTNRHGGPLRVLVVEDEWMLADELRRDLEDAGVIVLGPVRSREEALQMMTDGHPPDAAVLDVNLNGDLVYPLATILREQGVPFAFATGYDRSTLPGAFAGVACFEKPVSTADLLAVLVGQGQAPTRGT